jgi:hypothetical protein
MFTQKESSRGSQDACCQDGKPPVLNNSVSDRRDKPILSSEMVLHKDNYRKRSVKKLLVVSFKGLSARVTDWR